MAPQTITGTNETATIAVSGQNSIDWLWRAIRAAYEVHLLKFR
ncbi:hypothetical protein ACQPZQ_15885 [Pseudonocardia sp. CA-142604]